MKANRGPGQSTRNWILNHRSHYNWHSSVFKNASCNYVCFAQAGYIEDHLTSKYCKKMLHKLDSVAFIHQELKSLLSSHVKPKRALTPSHPTLMKIIKEYIFPDSIMASTKNIKKLMVHITDVVSTQDSNKVLKTQCQGLLNLIKHIKNTPFVVTRPDTTLLTPAISHKIEALKEVCFYLFNKFEYYSQS